MFKAFIRFESEKDYNTFLDSEMVNALEVLGLYSELRTITVLFETPEEDSDNDC